MAVAHFLCGLMADPHYSTGSVFLVLVLCGVSEGMCFHLRYQALDARTAKLLSKSFDCEGQPKRRELPEMWRSSNGLIHIEAEHRACAKAQ